MTRRLRYLDERDHDIFVEEKAEDERIEAEAQFDRWLAGRRTGEGYEDADPAFDARDPGDRLEREGGRL